MKNFLYILLLFTLLLSGCKRHDIYENAILEGQKALSNSEYDAAIEQVKIALEERKGDVDAMVLIKQTEKYVTALNYYHELKYSESIKLLNSVINMVNGSDDLINRAEVMKNVVEDDKQLDTNIKHYTVSAQNYFKSGNYEKALQNINIALEYIDNNENYEIQKSALNSLKDNCYYALSKSTKKENISNEKYTNIKDNKQDKDKDKNKEEDKEQNKDKDKEESKEEEEKETIIQNEVPTISKSQAKDIVKDYIESHLDYEPSSISICSTNENKYYISALHPNNEENDTSTLEYFYVDIYTGDVSK